MTNLNTGFEQPNGIPRDEIVEALIAMQKAIAPVVKASENPHFRSKYADLAALWAAVRNPIHANGFVLVHTTQTIDGVLCLRSALRHVSGAELFTHLPLMHRQGDMQSLMAAITYAKRGNLGCLTGVVTEDEDDDGNNTRPVQHAGGATKDTSAPKPAPRPTPPPMSQRAAPTSDKPSDPVQASGKNADGSTKPHTLPPPLTTGDVTKFVDRLIDHLGERPISKVRASEWVAANSETLEKIKAKTPVLFKRFEEAYEGIRGSSQAID
ncbi:MAG: hypothetical protein E6Q97_03550 [Desulfurellales bacterium]|nr:MAG: hypothetical protein E6Q97_03550 [Desulfurellales bacterium]